MEGNITNSKILSLGSDTDSPSPPLVTPSFFSCIEDQFGLQVKNHLKEWTNNNRRLAEATSKRQFLIRCRQNDLDPQHILDQNNSNKNVSFCSHSCSKYFQKLNRYFCKKLLILEIRDIHIHIKFLNKLIQKAKKHIMFSDLVPNTKERFFDLTKQKFNSIRQTFNDKHNKKFDLLLSKKHNHSNLKKKMNGLRILLKQLYPMKRLTLFPWVLTIVFRTKLQNKMLLTLLRI